jgi:hypothetical protein
LNRAFVLIMIPRINETVIIFVFPSLKKSVKLIISFQLTATMDEVILLEATHIHTHTHTHDKFWLGAICSNLFQVAARQNNLLHRNAAHNSCCVIWALCPKGTQVTLFEFARISAPISLHHLPVSQHANTAQSRSGITEMQTIANGTNTKHWYVEQLKTSRNLDPISIKCKNGGGGDFMREYKLSDSNPYTHGSKLNSTQFRGPQVGTSVSFSGGPGFKSQPGDRLSSLRLFIFLSLSRQILGQYLKYATATYLHTNTRPVP